MRRQTASPRLQKMRVARPSGRYGADEFKSRSSQVCSDDTCSVWCKGCQRRDQQDAGQRRHSGCSRGQVFQVPSTCNDESLKLFTRGRTRPPKRTALRRLCRHHAQCDPRNLAACNYKLVVF